MNKIESELKEFYKEYRVVITMCASIVGLVLLRFFWYVLVPAIAVWYLWKESHLRKSLKIKLTVLVCVLAIVGFSINLYVNRAPTILVTSPEDNATVQVDNKITSINGSVIPSRSVLTINGKIISTEKGKFTYEALLFREKNVFDIKVKNGGKTIQKTFTINRVYSEQEKADIAAQALKVKQAQEAQAAKEKAEQESYEKSPAGRLCKKHTDWSRYDCERVSENLIWIGMSLDMLKAEIGTPNSANPSNYGRGNEWQWCWHDNTPSCFYGGDDGIITGYN